MPNEQKMHHLRFNVPDCDEKVMAFIDAQHNLSMSLRLLVQTYVDEHGYIDATSTSAGDAKPAKKQPKHDEQVTQPPHMGNAKQQAVAQIAAMQGGSQVNDLQSMLNS